MKGQAQDGTGTQNLNVSHKANEMGNVLWGVECELFATCCAHHVHESGTHWSKWARLLAAKWN